MWLLVSLALAADPPPVAPAAAAPAMLRRTCEAGQLCDGRCIPWTEPCAAALAGSLDAMAKQASEARLSAAVCGPSPAPPTVERDPAETFQEQILLATAAGVLCGSASQRDPDACRPADEPVVAKVTPPPAPTCGAATPPPGR